MRAFELVAGVLLATACSRPTPSRTDAPAASAEAAVDCDHALEPPAGAELLCNEHVMGADAEIHWQSYATRESRAAVNARYRERATRCKLGLVTDSKEFTIVRGNSRLTTHDAAVGGYPACEKKPSAPHATVIVVSSSTTRPP